MDVVNETLHTQSPSIQNDPAPSKPDFDDVGLFGLSFRGYATFLLLSTCCGMWLLGKDVPPALLVMTSTTLTFYFKR